MDLGIEQIWIAGGVLLGFQVTSFAWRIAREVSVSDKGEIGWITAADYLNLAAMVVTVGGVFVLPILALAGPDFGRMAFGLGAILFVGHSFAVAAHYELFNPKTRRSYQPFPRQEKVAVALVGAASLVYILAWLMV